MKMVTFLLCGNHPKSFGLKERIVKIIQMLKKAPNNQLPIKAFEDEFKIDRIKESTKFYRPFRVMKEWELLMSNKKMIFDKKGKRRFKTTYELTPKLFVRHLKHDVVDVCETELEMI